MSYRFRQTMTKAATSVAGGATTPFDFSSTGKKGDLLRISLDVGSFIRFTIDGTNPDSTLTNIDSDDQMVYLDAGNHLFALATLTDDVRIYTKSAVTTLGVTLGILSPLDD